MMSLRWIEMIQVYNCIERNSYTSIHRYDIVSTCDHFFPYYDQYRLLIFHLNIFIFIPSGMEVGCGLEHQE